MAIYRKHRPQTFSALVGQESAKLLLQNSLIRNNTAHAYLFTGTRGTGKTSSARIFARAVTCLKPISNKSQFEPCNKCANCLSHLNNTTTDFIEIDAASNRGIDDIRTIREQVQYPPNQLNKRIYLIDEVHMLSNDAFNALLKTLEEPPTHALFILATTELHKVPLTVRSRCQVVKFERAVDKAIIDKLQSIIQAEGWTVDVSVLPLIAEHADGSFRDAETILEDLSTRFTKLDLAAAQQALGFLDAKIIELVTDYMLAKNNTSLDDVMAQINPQNINSTIKQVIQAVRKEFLRNLANDNIFSFALESLLEASILTKSSPIPTLPFEIALHKIHQRSLASKNETFTTDTPQTQSGIKTSIDREAPATPHKQAPINVQSADEIPHITKSVKKSGDTTENNIKAPSSVSIEVKPIKSQEASVPVIEIREKSSHSSVNIRKAWHNLVEKIVDYNGFLAELMKEALIVKTEGDTIILQVRYQFHADKINEKKNLHKIKEILEDITGLKWNLQIEINPSIPRAEPKKKLESGPQEIDLTKDIEKVFELSGAA